MAEEKYTKISFSLEQDVDGYPPDKWETIWAYEMESGLYCVDNIPFYVKGISCGDVISAEIKEGQLEFKELVRPSTNSVFRVYVSNAADVKAVRDLFRNLGCESELSNLPKLIAIDIPGSVPIEPILKLFDEGVQKGVVSRVFRTLVEARGRSLLFVFSLMGRCVVLPRSGG
ncbi:MAG: DUF4265 domain-containing protein [Terriglobales bacterium]